MIDRLTLVHKSEHNRPHQLQVLPHPQKLLPDLAQDKALLRAQEVYQGQPQDQEHKLLLDIWKFYQKQSAEVANLPDPYCIVTLFALRNLANHYTVNRKLMP